MSVSQPSIRDHKRAALAAAYARETARLLPLAEADTPQGEYAFPVFGEGAADGGVLLVGEAPGAEETRLRRPFVGKAGRQLDALLELAGISRETLYISNVVKYRPVLRTARGARNRPPKPAEVTSALPLLLTELTILRPRLVVSLGNTPLCALQMLAGADKPFQTVGALHGCAHPLSVSGLPVELFPLYHPASGIYNHSLLPVMEQDARRLGEHLVKAGEQAFVCRTVHDIL